MKTKVTWQVLKLLGFNYILKSDIYFLGIEKIESGSTSILDVKQYTKFYGNIC